MSSWVSAKVVGRKIWAPGLVTLQLDARLDFKPGQFTNVAIEREGTRLRRSYSLASAPGEPAELYVNEVVQGGLSPQLIALDAGDSVQLDSKASGFFTLDELSGGEELWLLATGTGLGPYISMLRSGQAQAQFGKVIVVHAVREQQHFGYRAELEQLQSSLPGKVKIIFVTSRQEPPTGGLRGRIPALISDGQLEGAAGCALDVSRSRVLLCGNPQMILDAQSALQLRGLNPHRRRAPGHILTEKYW
jgi:ferredoxin--NADP+ reductase